MEENTYWLGFWALFVTLIVSTTWVVMHHLNAKDEMMIKAGFVQQQVPAHYTTEWVKPDAK